ncbi:Putative transcriptional regulator, AraC/XylS family protein (fragment) [Vibrio aestuarianus]
MIRKLKQEGTQYRELLSEVRMNHALNFGLTASAYMKTIINPPRT